MAKFTTEWLVKHHVPPEAFRTLNRLEAMGMSKDNAVKIDPEKVRAELGYTSRFTVDRHIRELCTAGVLEKAGARTYKVSQEVFE